MSHYSITAAGETALRIIRQVESASVMGVTSRGVFCSITDGKVFFLSFEAWRGPLTFNIDLGIGSEGAVRYSRVDRGVSVRPFDRLTQGSVVKLLPDRIQFEDEDITIRLADIPAWKASFGLIQPAELKQARFRLEKTARIVLKEGNGTGWKDLIPSWVGIESRAALPEGLREVEYDLHHLENGLRGGNGDEFIFHTARLLGRGSGLTPSGDDFIIGLVLGARALAEHVPFFRVVSEKSQDLIKLARQKTTTLSANLIVCALDGQADERLVSALDGILKGSLPEEECARRLLDYGGSSGSDSLLGMAMAIQPG